jgi:hypothetical protein
LHPILEGTFSQNHKGAKRAFPIHPVVLECPSAPYSAVLFQEPFQKLPLPQSEQPILEPNQPYSKDSVVPLLKKNVVSGLDSLSKE